MTMFKEKFHIVTGQWVIIEAAGKYIGRRVAVVLRVRGVGTRVYREMIIAQLSTLGVLFNVMWCPMCHVIGVSTGPSASLVELDRVNNIWINNEAKIPTFHTISQPDDQVAPFHMCQPSCDPHLQCARKAINPVQNSRTSSFEPLFTRKGCFGPVLIEFPPNEGFFVTLLRLHSLNPRTPEFALAQSPQSIVCTLAILLKFDPVLHSLDTLNPSPVLTQPPQPFVALTPPLQPFSLLNVLHLRLAHNIESHSCIN
jgi:hypothetical protein